MKTAKKNAVSRKAAVSPVDRLGELMAQIASLSAEAEQIKAELKEKVGEHFGKVYKATVWTAVKETIETAKVKKILTPAQLKKVTKKTSYTSLTISKTH